MASACLRYQSIRSLRITPWSTIPGLQTMEWTVTDRLHPQAADIFTVMTDRICPFSATLAKKMHMLFIDSGQQKFIFHLAGGFDIRQNKIKSSIHHTPLVIAWLKTENP